MRHLVSHKVLWQMIAAHGNCVVLFGGLSASFAARVVVLVVGSCNVGPCFGNHKGA